MTITGPITIDPRYDRDSGAFGLIVEFNGQAPILMELEGCDSSFQSVLQRAAGPTSSSVRWCIVRLVPVEGNELLLLDFERLQSFKKGKKNDK